MTKTYIFIAERYPESTIRMIEKMDHKKDFVICGFASDGKECLEKITQLKQINILIIDLIMPTYDGYYVLNQIKTLPVKIDFIICMSNLVNDKILQYLNDLEIDLFILKPYEPTSLYHNLQEIGQKGTKSFNKTIIPSSLNGVSKSSYTFEMRLTKMMHQLGIPGHIRGYSYMKNALEMAYLEPNVLGKITKVIYPDIAKIHMATSSGVERALRHAITLSWKHWSINNIDEILGFQTSCFRKRPTNAEFIAFIANKLRLEDKNELLNQISDLRKK